MKTFITSVLLLLALASCASPPVEPDDAEGTTTAPESEPIPTTAPPTTEEPTTVAPLPLVQDPEPTDEPAQDCMSGYSPCLPIESDMNCSDINHPVMVTGSDPYGLDRDGDGVGCD